MKRKNSFSENATKGDLVILEQEFKQEMRGLREEIDEKARKYRDDVDFAIMIGAVLAFIILILNSVAYAFGIFTILIFLVYMRIIIKT